MKRKTIYALGFSALFITASLFSSCKKGYTDQEQVPDLTADVFYKQRVVGSSTDEYRAVKVNGTDDRKLNVVLPAGWELTNAPQINEGYLRVVSGYNPTSKQYGLFTKVGWDGDIFTQQREISSLNDIIPQSSFSGGMQGILYSTRTPANSLQFSYTIPYGLILGGEFTIPLPANANFVGEPILRASGDKMTYATRVEDPSTHQYIYSIHKRHLNGSGSTVVVTGEPGVVLAAEQLIYPNVLLYSKVTNNGLVTELWSVNLDGSNDRKIELALPAGIVLKNKDMARVNLEGRMALLCTTSADNAATANEAIYTVNTKGSDVKLVKKFASGISIGLQSYATYVWY